MLDGSFLGHSYADVIQALLNGVMVGGLYALIALGIVVINKSSGVFNFAHGWMMFMGAMFFWQFYQVEPSSRITFGMSGVAALLIMGVIGSLGLAGGNLPPITRPLAPIETDRPQSAWQRRFSAWRDKLSDAVFAKRFAVAVAGGIVAWFAVGYLLSQDDQPILRGFVGTFIASILLGLIIERFAIRTLLGQPLLTAILMTLAIGFVLQGTIQIVWGSDARSIPIFKEPDRPSYTSVPQSSCESLGYVFVPPNNCQIGVSLGKTLPDYPIKTNKLLGKDLLVARPLVWGFGISILTFAIFTFIFQYTSIGLALRATAENQVLAESVGLRVRLILAIAWALVATMAGVAGVLQAISAGGISETTVPFVALQVFPAILLGGLDSIKGALVGGLMLGVIERVATIYISFNAATNMVVYVVLIAVLLFRPEGLYGQRRIDRV